MLDNERTLDRVIKFDKNSKKYPIKTLLPDAKPASKSWAHVQLDQGKEGACAGFSATMEAAANPIPVFGSPMLYKLLRKSVVPINQKALDIYHRAQQLDEFPGENYVGSSVLGSLKAGVEQGWWKEYRWALGPGSEAAAQDVIMAISHIGPVMMGTNWYEGMYNADNNGYLNVIGKVTGGHAWLLTKYSATKDAVWTPNSWGGSGQGWVSRSDLVKLLHASGEAAIPTSTKVK